MDARESFYRLASTVPQRAMRNSLQARDESDSRRAPAEITRSGWDCARTGVRRSDVDSVRRPEAQDYLTISHFI
jgi:hypothetical protein